MKKYGMLIVVLIGLAWGGEAKRPTLFSTSYRKEKIKKAIRWKKNMGTQNIVP